MAAGPSSRPPILSRGRYFGQRAGWRLFGLARGKRRAPLLFGGPSPPEEKGAQGRGLYRATCLVPLRGVRPGQGHSLAGRNA